MPRSSVYPPGQSQQQTDQQNTQDFTDSQDNATAAAACELGYPKRFGVIGVRSNGAGRGVLQPADVLKTVDGQPAATAAQLTQVLSAKAPGTTVSVALTRAGSRQDRVTSSWAHRSRAGRAARSASRSATSAPAPFTVDLGLGNQIGGPSAGLMFALGIMDKVGPVDLTNGPLHRRHRHDRRAAATSARSAASR